MACNPWLGAIRGWPVSGQEPSDHPQAGPGSSSPVTRHSHRGVTAIDPTDPQDQRARKAIVALLDKDETREWSCEEMAATLRLTKRTIAREVNLLVQEGVAQRQYGKQKRLTFKRLPPAPMPAWLMGVTAEQLAQLDKLVVGGRTHRIDGGRPDDDDE